MVEEERDQLVGFLDTKAREGIIIVQLRAGRDLLCRCGQALREATEVGSI
jgi:hypothetical protein